MKAVGKPKIAAVILIAPKMISAKLNHETKSSSIPNNLCQKVRFREFVSLQF